MTTFIIILLSISQIVSFYLIFRKIKPIIKPDGILLKPISKEFVYSDIDPNFNLIYDVLESIKIEGWALELEKEYSIGDSHDYSLAFKSHDDSIRVRSRVCIYTDSEPYLSFYINSDVGCSINIDKNSPIKNDIILFLWDYILVYHEGKRLESRKYYDDGLKNISSKLKTLNRSRRLNEIL